MLNDSWFIVFKSTHLMYLLELLLDYFELQKYSIWPILIHAF